jgi:RNA 2',3'-cyclic 3'-phosphodiesterase
MRLFIAIEFSKTLRDDIQQWTQSLAREIPDPDHRLHWVKENQLHLTLKFLGETREDRIPRLHQAIQIATSDQTCFPLSLAKVGHFGGRVVWLGVETGVEEVTKLAQSIENSCESLGFVRENRHFHPHITLARSKINPGTIHFADLPPQITQRTFNPFTVGDVCLIQSTLTPRGSIYETLERFPLKS